MTRLNILTAGLLAATLATPVMAQEVLPEPGPIAQNYPDSDYITGGCGARMTPGPRYYCVIITVTGRDPRDWRLAW